MNHYNRNHPFIASIKERYPLCLPESNKNTQHVVIDLKGSGIRYNVGDSIGIYPSHHDELVERTLKALKTTGDEEIVHKKSGEKISLRHYLTSEANITDVSRKFLQVLSEKQFDPEKKHFLKNLLQCDDNIPLKKYIDERELWDILEENPEAVFSTQELSDLLMPLLPRLYSISSSQSVVGDKVHLTLAVVSFYSNTSLRRGVCTHYLGEMVPLGSSEIPIYIQPGNDFTLPEDTTAPIIMIGPGTGIAPFRAFMQEREHQRAKGKNWLFFGEWNATHHYYYKDFWQDLSDRNILKVETAFSRDQPEKIYVQHRMWENAEELYRWILEGAYLYVCGDKDRMARDVENTLLQIFQTQGKMNEEKAKAFLKQLRGEKRYCKDVY